MDITLLETPNSNIGNGFLSKGALACVTRAFPNATISSVSLYPDYMADRYFSRRGQLSQKFRDGPNERKNNTYRNSMLNVAEFIDTELAVIPGCILGNQAFNRYYETLKRLTERQVPVLFLGVGAGNYEQNTIENVKENLQNLNVAGLITRDEECYRSFSDVVEMSYNGIDCAFFIDEWYSGPPANTEFSAFTFDKISEPDVNVDGKTIRPDHSPLRPFQQPITELSKEFIGIGEDLPPNHFVSDKVTDYLFIYDNANETHSDRIHACLPALVFGNKARFYYETPRANLFDRVGASEIRERAVSLDMPVLEQEKDEQIEYLKKIASAL